VQADNAQRPPLVEPRDQLVAAADAQAAEIEDVKPVAAPFAQRDALQGFDVVVEGRADKDADLKIWHSDCRQSWNRCTSASKPKNGSALRFRDSEIRQ
jgi:hypothetical protein